GAGGVVGLVEEFAFGQMQAVDDAVSGPDAVELGYIARRLGENASGVQGSPGGLDFEIFNVGLEDAGVAVGESGRRAAALLQLLLTGGGTGIDQNIADAKLLDKAERLFARSGAD